MLRFVDSFSKYPSNRNFRSADRQRSGRQLDYQNLETRHLLASISFDSLTGVVLIQGDDLAETAQVDYSVTTNEDNVTITLTGVANQTFATSSVSEVRFEAGGGNDFFQNFTSIPSNVTGGAGNDSIFGGRGDDIITGGNGNDVIFGGGGNDTLSGNADGDEIDGGPGDDIIFGGAGADEIRGEIGDDMLSGHEGDDFILGGDGNDQVWGGDGDDQIYGGFGDDTLHGELGADTLQGNDGEDLIHGGADDDFILGGAGDDLLIGQDGVDRINGDDGDDVIFGEGGNDLLTGGDGADRVFGNDGDDFIDGGLGNDRLFGNADDDDLRGGNGVDLIYGGTDDDTIFGEDGDDTLIGNQGDDFISGDNGNDIVFGDTGDDLIRGGEGEDELFGQFGNDIIYGLNANDLILGGEGDDTLFGGFGDDLIFGSDGNDDLYGQVGIDVLLGQAGNDGSFGGVTGGDTIIDRLGNNRFVDFGNDVIAEVTNADTRLDFRHGNSFWTNREVEGVDRGLQLLHDRTQSTRVLKGTITDEPLVFVKNSTLSNSSLIATNELIPRQSLALNAETGTFELVTTHERTYTFGDWDEQDESAQELRTSQLPGLIARNWASTEAISSVIPSQGSYWNSFLQLSGWTQERPDPISFFEISQDNAWWFLRTARFADSTSTENPQSDFASTWNLYFRPGADADRVRLVNKINRVDQLFEFLEFV